MAVTNPNLAGEQPGGLRLAIEVTLEASADLVADVEDGGVDDAVEDVDALFAAANDAGAGEGGELAGDVGLGGVGRLDELGDIALPGLEGDDQLEPGGIAEDLEPVGDQLQSFIGKRVAAGRLVDG